MVGLFKEPFLSKFAFLALPALAGALLGGSAAAFAQSATAPPYAMPGAGPAGAPPAAYAPRRRSPLQQALRGLALTPGQRARIRNYTAAYRQSRASGVPEKRAQLIAQIEGVLTPDQRSLFATQLRRARHPAGGVGSPPYQQPNQPNAEPPQDERGGSSEPAPGPSTPP
jgi:Spy/CpxP family protein refolding chaperone